MQQSCLGLPLARCTRDLGAEELAFFRSTFRLYHVTGMACRFVAWVSFVWFGVSIGLLMLGVPMPDWFAIGMIGLLTGMGACVLGVKIWPYDRLLGRDRKGQVFEIYEDEDHVLVRSPHAGLVISYDHEVSTTPEWVGAVTTGPTEVDWRFPARLELGANLDASGGRKLSHPELAELRALIRTGWLTWLTLAPLLATLIYFGQAIMVYYSSVWGYVLPFAFVLWLWKGLRIHHAEATCIFHLIRDLRGGELVYARLSGGGTSLPLELLPNSAFVWTTDNNPAMWRVFRSPGSV